jgi:hypothetical protein
MNWQKALGKRVLVAKFGIKSLLETVVKEIAPAESTSS